MIISLAGLPGSGKSTIRNLLAEKLGYKKYAMGDLRGKMALDRGMNIDQLNELGMTEDFTDKEVDSYQEKLGKTEDDFIADGWMSWHAIPHSLKVFLEVRPEVGATRVFNARRNKKDRQDEPEYQTVEEAQQILDERVQQNRARYQKWYNVDYLDRNNYDVIIDTSDISPEEVVERILTKVQDSATLRP